MPFLALYIFAILVWRVLLTSVKQPFRCIDCYTIGLVTSYGLWNFGHYWWLTVLSHNLKQFWLIIGSCGIHLGAFSWEDLKTPISEKIENRIFRIISRYPKLPLLAIEVRDHVRQRSMLKVSNLSWGKYSRTVTSQWGKQTAVHIIIYKNVPNQNDLIHTTTHRSWNCEGHEESKT